MRVGPALVVHPVEVRGRRGVEDVLRLRLVDRLVDRRLEAGQVHDQVSVDEGGDVAGASSRSCGSCPPVARLSTST